MNQNEAASLLQAIADSISKNPGQFRFEVKTIGTSATAIGGGVGLSVTATGGGPGSHTIGYQSQVTGANIQIAQKEAADELIQREMALLVTQIQTIADELRKQSPNHDAIRKIYDSLKNTWVPGVIISVIGNVLTMALGIHL